MAFINLLPIGFRLGGIPFVAAPAYVVGYISGYMNLSALFINFIEKAKVFCFGIDEFDVILKLERPVEAEGNPNLALHFFLKCSSHFNWR